MKKATKMTTRITCTSDDRYHMLLHHVDPETADQIMGLLLGVLRRQRLASPQASRPQATGLLDAAQFIRQHGLDPARVHEVLRAGQKIEAIKLVRHVTDLGLKEAKEFVDQFQFQVQ